MKLQIGKETLEEPNNYRFQLIGNKLSLVNHFNNEIRAKFMEGIFEKVIPNRHLNEVRRKLNGKRKVEI